MTVERKSNSEKKRCQVPKGPDLWDAPREENPTHRHSDAAVEPRGWTLCSDRSAGVEVAGRRVRECLVGKGKGGIQKPCIS